jgi:transposase
MLKVSDNVQIYVCCTIVDMRKSIDGLSALVLESLSLDAHSSAVFVFCNRACNKVKCLVWDKNGFVLHYKRLEKGKFHLKSRDGLLIITPIQLSWLLAGLDFQLMHEFPDLNYAHFY